MFDICFCILIYRNYNDLQDFINSTKKLDLKTKIVVVDAFFSKECSLNIKKMCEINNCDYLSIDNKGYSYGNNYGINYILNNYGCRKIIVSNPDIIINKITEDCLTEDYFIIAPEIRNKKGKLQNPFYYSQNNFKEKMLYKSYKAKNKLLLYVVLFFQKIVRIFKLNKSGFIYGAHGAFLIFDAKMIKEFMPIFDDNMFLFSEENYLARFCKENNLFVYYDRKIKIYHKEDGSMMSVNTYELTRKSYMYYYEKYVRENK